MKKSDDVTNKDLTDEDKNLWAAFSAKITPLKHVTPKTPPKTISLTTKPKPVIKQDVAKPKIIENIKQYELISFSAKQLRKIKIEATLDLHGLSVDQAEYTMTNFINHSIKAQRRWVLVITGKGLGSKEKVGVLKGFLQNWVKAHKNLIIGFCEAKPNHGGSGAFYINIRKLK